MTPVEISRLITEDIQTNNMDLSGEISMIFRGEMDRFNLFSIMRNHSRNGEKCFANIPFQTLGSSEDTVRSNMRFLKALIQKEPCWISDPYPIKIIGSLEDQKTCRRIEPNVMSSGVGFIISV